MLIAESCRWLSKAWYIYMHLIPLPHWKRFCNVTWGVYIRCLFLCYCSSACESNCSSDAPPAAFGHRERQSRWSCWLCPVAVSDWPNAVLYVSVCSFSSTRIQLTGQAAPTLGAFCVLSPTAKAGFHLCCVANKTSRNTILFSDNLSSWSFMCPSWPSTFAR